MLPNGEVVPIPAAERWAAEAAAAEAAAAAAGVGAAQERSGLKEALDDLRVGGPAQGSQQAWLLLLLQRCICANGLSSQPQAAELCLPVFFSAFFPQDILSAPAGMLAAPAGRALARGTGLAVRSTDLAARAAGGSAWATAMALGKAAGPLRATSQRLPMQVSRCCKSEAHLPSAASGSGDIDAVAAAAAAELEGAQAGDGSGRLLRVHSSPDSSLLPDQLTASEASGSAQAVPGKLQAPVRLLRQSSNLAAAVLSRLSRASSAASGADGHRGRSSLGPAEPVQADAVAARTASSGEHAGGSAEAEAATELRQQRERELHERALAELAVLAGPAAAMRPPELPSAAGNAEAAELRAQQQLALFQYRRQSLEAPGRLARTLGTAGGSMELAGAGGVLRTSTAPPAVATELASMAAEQQQMLSARRQQLPAVPSGTSFASAGEPQAVPGDHPARPAAAHGGASAAQEPRAAEVAAPSLASAAAAAPAPSGGAAVELSERPSMLHRMLSAASIPWRGRTVSSTWDSGAPQALPAGGEGGAGCEGEGCQSSAISMYSLGSTLPTASLIELSSECAAVSMPDAACTLRRTAAWCIKHACCLHLISSSLTVLPSGHPPTFNRRADTAELHPPGPARRCEPSSRRQRPIPSEQHA